MSLQLWGTKKISISDRDQLPHKPGIYYAIDCRGNVRYVGKAEDLYDRWNGNHHQLNWLIHLKGGAWLRYRIVPRHRLLYEEALDIKHFNPDRNKQRPEPEKHYSWLIRFDDTVSWLVVFLASSVAAIGISCAMGNPIALKLVDVMREKVERSQ